MPGPRQHQCHNIAIAVALVTFTLLYLVGANNAAAAADDASPSPKLVVVPSGTITPFWLAALSTKSTIKKKDKPLFIKSFAVMVHQVTIVDYKRFLQSHAEWNKESISPLFSDGNYLVNLNNPKVLENAPMTSISWFAAKAYCESIGMRLPTTDEWEYMAAASETSRYAANDPRFLQRILDWYSEPQGDQIDSVGSVYKNSFGIWDLHGLVWEWVEDFNSNFVTGESREDSSLNKDMFCGAGGQTGANKENYAAFMRFAFRSSLKGKSSVANLGFRCVR